MPPTWQLRAPESVQGRPWVSELCVLTKALGLGVGWGMSTSGFSQEVSDTGFGC